MHASSVNDIVASVLCTGCGACESIAGRHTLRMGLSPEGFLRLCFHLPPAPCHPGDRVVRMGLLEARPREAWTVFSGVLTRLLKGRIHESLVTAPPRAAIESGE